MKHDVASFKTLFWPLVEKLNVEILWRFTTQAAVQKQ